MEEREKMGEKDDGLRLGLGLGSLGLGLGLGCDGNQSSVKMNPTHKPSQLVQKHKGSWSEMFRFPADGNPDAKSTFLDRVDVNRLPSMADCEDENGVSSPNSTISSISGKRSDRSEPNGEENEAERASCSRESDEEDGGSGGDPSRKKLRLSKEQSLVLEETFKEHNTLNPNRKLGLAKQLNLSPRQVEVWFQNRRARTKLKQTEVDYEYLKRCCENLTEENRRLQKEVQELRALKLCPQFYMHMNPPTTLTMCPSCERVAVSSSYAVPSSTAAPIVPTRPPVVPNVQQPVPVNPIASLPFDAHISPS